MEEVKAESKDSPQYPHTLMPKRYWNPWACWGGFRHLKLGCFVCLVLSEPTFIGEEYLSWELVRFHTTV